LKKSSLKEIQAAEDFVLSIRKTIETLVQQGKKVHVIWDFDGVLTDSRSDDVFQVSGYDLEAYFDYEERRIFDCPESGIWLLPIAYHCGKLHTSQDIVTARSSFLSMRVIVFCIQYNLKMRWQLFLGHQSKTGAFQIILDSFRNDSDYHIFFVDDNQKHVDEFTRMSSEMKMSDRTHGIVAPVIRKYTKREITLHFKQVMGATGDIPLRVRDPSNEYNGFIVFPQGVEQFKTHIKHLSEKTTNEGYCEELRQVFKKVYGDTLNEEELERAMRDFIVGKHCS